MFFRTDLAVEARELAGGEVQGVQMETSRDEGITITRMRICTPEAAEQLGKGMGSYITVEVPPFTDNSMDVPKHVELIAAEIARLLPENGLVLVAGLGNSNITPDNLGPRAAASVLATRHITGELARVTGLSALRPVAVLAPGVLGQTGIETGELLFSVAERLHPCALIVVDALASRRLERLGCTVQISDTGISPGAGVGNARPRIDAQTMGIPVISMGVPTVVDAATLATDLLDCENENEEKTVQKKVSPRGEAMMVTPREIDLLIQRAARMTGMAINCALQPDFSMEDLASLVS
jgi:spore protease